jgi:hypothetical protein
MQLRQIGFVEYVAKQTKWTSQKPGKRGPLEPRLLAWCQLSAGLILAVLAPTAFYAALHKKEFQAASEALRKGFASDYWFSSAGGISEVRSSSCS